MHPAQLEARHPEQPEERDFTCPPLLRVMPLKPEKSFSIFRDRHFGQTTFASDADPITSFSKVCSHFKHSYSNIGTLASGAE